MYTEMTMADAKKDFHRGLLSGFAFERNLGQIHVVFEVAAGGTTLYAQLVDARTRKVRFFKSWDSAVRAVEEVGFQVSTLAGR